MVRSKSRWCVVLCLVAWVVLPWLSSQGQEVQPKTPPPGKIVAPFQLDRAEGGSWSWDECAKSKAVVVLFIGVSCPINNNYLPKLAALYREYSPKGVYFLAINANKHESPAIVAKHAKEYQIPFPVLKDVNNVVADRMGAQRTPEVFLLDSQGAILYQGRIDDQFGIGYKRTKPLRQDLVEAMEDHLAGRPIRQASTPVAGCLIARVTQPKENATVGYHSHVAPILQKHCQWCHRPGEIGPMSLLTFKDAAGWGDSIREVVTERRMPPWHADVSQLGRFRNERWMTDQEMQTLLSWIDAGCPEGTTRSTSIEKPSFVEGWRMGQPDKIYAMQSPFKVPAEMPERGVPYQYMVLERRVTEDLWVQAMEARPGQRAVVHHIIAYVRQPGQRDRNEGIGDGFLCSYVPGDEPAIFPPGFGKKLPKGSVLFLQMHYTPNGVACEDLSSLGVIFCKEPPKHEIKTRSIHNTRFVIPPGAAHHQVTAATVFQKEVMLLSLSPHMHLRGKDFEYTIVYPDGRRKVVLSVPRYDFNWQTNYILKEPLRLPKGTKIECVAHFDNSENNPNNPNPKARVRWGDQTWEEMMIGFVDYYVVDGSNDDDD